jgi:hypothetical protein
MSGKLLLVEPLDKFVSTFPGAPASAHEVAVLLQPHFIVLRVSESAVIVVGKSFSFGHNSIGFFSFEGYTQGIKISPELITLHFTTIPEGSSSCK